MSRPRQYHKRQAKARQRQRRTATERLQRDRSKRHTPPRPSWKPLMIGGFPNTL
jgi:hypothetical protein